ncbi:MAG: hypothetical protein ACT4OJ_15115 [Bacteroidota bacterium]
MQKGGIIHFVGFITGIEPEDFVTQWEQYARHFKTRSGGMFLQQQQESKTKFRFKYLSRHEYREGDILFSFMKERSSEHFPEQQVKVVQAGGYSPLQVEYRYPGSSKDATVMVFVSQKKNDAGFYRHLTYHKLNIYEAYYENCVYNYILEFQVAESALTEILLQLKLQPDIEISVYKECMVPHM